MRWQRGAQRADFRVSPGKCLNGSFGLVLLSPFSQSFGKGIDRGNHACATPRKSNATTANTPRDRRRGDAQSRRLHQEVLVAHRRQVDQDSEDGGPWFANPQSDDERKIAEMIRDYNPKRIGEFEQGIFKQRKRVSDAQRILQTKTTKKATEDVRSGSEKIEYALGRLADIKRSDFKPRDARIFPGWYAPVIVSENGKPTVKLMRYQCRLAGKPKCYDTKYPGMYNARRDNLGGFWKDLFGYQHGIMLATDSSMRIGLQ